jgi:hypothetical protein
MHVLDLDNDRLVRAFKLVVLMSTCSITAWSDALAHVSDGCEAASALESDHAYPAALAVSGHGMGSRCVCLIRAHVAARRSARRSWAPPCPSCAASWARTSCGTCWSSCPPSTTSAHLLIVLTFMKRTCSTAKCIPAPEVVQRASLLVCTDEAMQNSCECALLQARWPQPATRRREWQHKVSCEPYGHFSSTRGT